MKNVWELEGTIVKIGETNPVTENFKKRDIVIESMENEYNGKVFTEVLKLEAIQQRTSELDLYSIGDNVKFGWTLSGRRYEKDGKENFFTSVRLIWIEKVDPVVPTQDQMTNTAVDAVTNKVAEDDDLPF